MVAKILRKAAILQITHPFLVLGIAGALAATAILYTLSNLEIHTSQKALISRENRLLELSKKIEDFDHFDTFVVVIESRDTDRSLAFLHALVDQLQADRRSYEQVFYRIDPDAFRPWTLQYLDKKDLVTIQDNLVEHRDFIHRYLESPGVVNLFREINHEMASKMVGELFTGFLDEKGPEGDAGEPMDLAFLIAVLREMQELLAGREAFDSPWESFFADGSWDDPSEAGYFWVGGKRYLLLLVTPFKERQSFTNAQKSLKALRTTIANVQEDFPGIRAGVTGEEALDEDEMAVALHDMSLATLLSLGGLVLLLVLFWRGLRRPLLEMTELVLALAWTFGLTTWLIGHLNILSITFAPLLLGLGIDYGIHWFARYQEEERLRSMDKNQRIQETMAKIGPGIVLASVTAALSFFPLVLTGFKGLVELGVICSIGMLMTTVTTLGVLPALTLIFDRSSNGGMDRKGVPAKRDLLRFSNRRAWMVLVPGGVGAALSLWAVSGVSFDLNMLNLQSKEAESVVWEKKLIQGSDRSSTYGVVLADSLGALQAKEEKIQSLPTVSETQSIVDLLPENRVEKVELLRRMKPFVAGLPWPEVPDESVEIPALDDVLGRIRFKMSEAAAAKWGANKPPTDQMMEVRGRIDRLREHFQRLEGPVLGQTLPKFQEMLIEDLYDKIDVLKANVESRPMEMGDLPPRLQERFVGENGIYLMRVYPAEDVWEPQKLRRFVEDLRSVDPDVIGDPVTLFVFTRAFRDACITAAVYASVFIIALLFMTFRNVASTLLAMTPLAVGTAWMLGLMRCFAVDFNLANSLFLPLIVGAGVEYGIIIVQRWRLDGREHRNMALPFSTAKGVIVAGLTTTVGFGSLAISNHQGIHSLGVLAIIGSLCILAAAVLWLPAVLQLIASGRKAAERESIAHLSVEPNVTSESR